MKESEMIEFNLNEDRTSENGKKTPSESAVFEERSDTGLASECGENIDLSLQKESYLQEKVKIVESIKNIV